MPYVPFTYGEGPVSSAKLNNNFAGKADLDPVTGFVVASQLPDLATVAHEALDAEIAAALAAATAAGAAANAADTAATAAQTAATAAETAAAAAQTTANAAIPTSQKAAALGVASLGSDGKVPLSQLPPLGGSSGPTLTAPLAADFPVWVNQGISASSDTPNGLLVVPELTGSSAGNILKGAFKNLPVGDFDVEAIVSKAGLDWPYFACGIALRETSSGRFLSAMQGRVYFPDPANNSLTGDWSGVCFQEWTNSGTVGPSQGIPSDTGEIHYRVTRIGSVVTLRARRGFNRPWINIWGISPDAMTFDQVGFCCNSNCYGSYTNWPEQPFVVRHWGAVLA